MKAPAKAPAKAIAAAFTTPAVAAALDWAGCAAALGLIYAAMCLPG